MIQEHTLIIFGAGANSSYGYPTGDELKRNIINHFPNIYLQYKPEAAQYELETINQFCSALDGSDDLLIDYFLDTCNNPQFVYYGKIAILMFIAESEKKVARMKNIDFTEDDWFPIMFNKLVEGIRDPRTLNKNCLINFITFNYDRFLEYRLTNSMKNKFSLDWKNSYDIVNKFEIIHVFDRLPSLPFEDRLKNYKYGDDIKFIDIHESTKNIKTISERGQIEKESIYGLISGAQKIYFLGFGYNKENLSLLDIYGNIKKNVQIYGTAYGLNAQKIIVTRNTIGRKKMFPTDSGKIVLSPSVFCLEEKMKCKELLEKYFL